MVESHERRTTPPLHAATPHVALARHPVGCQLHGHHGTSREHQPLHHPRASPAERGLPRDPLLTRHGHQDSGQQDPQGPQQCCPGPDPQRSPGALPNQAAFHPRC